MFLSAIDSVRASRYVAIRCIGGGLHTECAGDVPTTASDTPRADAAAAAAETAEEEAASTIAWPTSTVRYTSSTC